VHRWFVGSLLLLFAWFWSAPARAEIREVVLYAGQSNCTGKARDSVPEGIPSDAVKLWPYVFGLSNPDAFGPLAVLVDGTHGAELRLGQVLAGHWSGVAIVKVCHDGSLIRHWLPSAKRDWLVLEAEVAQVKKVVGPEARWHFVWNQGEKEATRSSGNFASKWLTDFNRLRAAVQATVGGKLPTVIVRTHAKLTRAPHLATVRAAQAKAGRMVDQDDLPLYDGTHVSGRGQNQLGERIAKALLAP
jgi:hypothetical protein